MSQMNFLQNLSIISGNDLVAKCSLVLRLWRQADFCTAKSPSPLRKFKLWSNWSQLFQCLRENAVYAVTYQHW